MDVNIKGSNYKIGKLNAFAQLHVVRRMAPITASLQDLADKYNPAAPMAILDPLGKALAALPDADVDYIINTCLDAVHFRQHGGGFAPVRSHGALMLELDMMTMLTLTVQVVKENLGSFFSELQQLLPAEESTQTSNG